MIEPCFVLESLPSVKLSRSGNRGKKNKRFNS